MSNIQREYGFEPFRSIDTIASHAGYNPMDHKSLSCPVIPPISLSTTFSQQAPSEHFGYDYSRGGNPTRQYLESCLAELENAKYASVFSSGLAAIAAIAQWLKSGDTVICNDDVYGGVNRYFRKIATKSGIATRFIDCTESLAELDQALATDSTVKLVWLETPTNPTMKLIDLEAAVKCVRKHSSDIVIVCDNTFMSPVFQRPLDYGCDVVMHSITKYINGHSDVVMGCLMTSSEKLREWISFHQMGAGACPSAFDCYLTLRGIRTLPLRMRQHMQSGLEVAKFLQSHSLVEKVLHPGLESHPQHQLAKRQMRGYSGMLSFYVKVSPSELISKLKIFTLAESLGGFESLIEVPAIMTHASVPAEQRQQLGITDNFIRLSVGVEDCAELIEDLRQALEACK